MAIVTRMWNPEMVNLVVFDPMGQEPPLNATSVTFSADGSQPHGCAHWAAWPQRVEIPLEGLVGGEATAESAASAD